MAAPTVTFVAGQEVWDFTELTLTTGSTFLHQQIHNATFGDDNPAIGGDFDVDLDYEYIPDPAVVPGSLFVQLTAGYVTPGPWTGTVSFDFSVLDSQLDFLLEGQTKSQQIKVTVWDNYQILSVDKFITINVHGKNDAPVANVDIKTTNENTSFYTLNVTGNDLDPDVGDHLQIVTSSAASVTSAAASFLTPAMVKIQNINFLHPTDTSFAKDSIKVSLDKAFQGLATGENALVVINYTVVDDFGATSASEFRLTVTGKNDTQIIGTDSADKFLFGEQDADTIYGNKGADIIAPRGGHDVIYGGAGKDKFVFSVKGDSKLADADVIKDFKHGDDKIDLSAFAGKFEFRGTGAFNGGHDIRYEAKSGYLHVLIDTNGDKTADMAIDVYGASSLVKGDFVL